MENGPLPASGRFLYPVPRWLDGQIQFPGVYFDFTSNCLPFREKAAFLFRYVLSAHEVPVECASDPVPRIPQFELNWLAGAAESDPPGSEADLGGNGGEVPGMEPEVSGTVVMRVDGREYFRAAHLGTAIAHFESYFSSEVACLSSEVCGYLHIHGAAVEMPHGTVLIIEEQERGKTSLAMGLMAMGAKPVSDDSLLLVPGERRVMRVPRSFRYHAGTERELAKFAPFRPAYSMYLDKNAEAPVYHFHDPFEETGFEAGTAGEICLILFPRYSPANEHTSLSPVRWSETLRTLIAQSMNPLDEDLYPKWFAALEKLPCFRLEWGGLGRAAGLVAEMTGGGLK